MNLLPGKAAEYKKRHDNLWPEMEKLLRDNGVSQYSIFFDEQSSSLFGVHRQEEGKDSMDRHQTEIFEKWCDYMSDIIETNPDNSPLIIPLTELFYLE